MTLLKEKKESLEQKAQRHALEALEVAGGKLTATEDIIYEGTKMVLPASMNIGSAIKFLKEKEEEEEMATDFSRLFDYNWRDGAAAVDRVCNKVFGGISQRPIKFMFFGEEITINPQRKTIPCAYDQMIEVPWGQFVIPMLTGVMFEMSMSRTGTLYVSAQGPRKSRFGVEGFFRAVQHELETNSIFRGKAIDAQYNFLDLTKVDESKVVYSDEVMKQLDANVWSLLKFTAAMRKNDLPLKRTVLFEGPYGTGKTLGAFLTAKIAEANGWTFIMSRPEDDFKATIETAKMYQPAVVFFEDVDTISSSGEADAVSKLLDTFDGMAAKGTEVVCVVTTNHVERIHKGMIRPGRLDAVVHIEELDASGLRRLIESIVPSDMMIEDEIDWEVITAAMEGFLPAFAKEAIDRTKRYNLARGHGTPSQLITEDFVEAANGLRPQLQLMTEATEGEKMPTMDRVLKSFFEQSGNMVMVNPGQGRIELESNK